MPEWRCGYYYSPMRVRVYRGFYGETAKMKIVYSQSRKGVRAVFV